MTIYLAFSEAEGLDASNGTQTSTSSTGELPAISGQVRAGFLIDDDFVASQDASWSTALTEGWAHVRIGVSDGTFGTIFDVFSVVDTAGNDLVTIRHDFNGLEAHEATISTVNTTDFATGVTGSGAFEGTWDIHIRVSDTTDGFIKVYREGSLLYSESGANNVASAVTQFDTVRFYGIDDSASHDAWFSQVIVADQSTIGALLYTLDPTAGTLNDWDSGTVTDVDETNVDDSDFIATTLNGDQFTIDTSVTLPDLSASNLEVAAVVQTWRSAYESGSAVTGITPFLNDTTATSTSFGTGQTMSETISNYHYVWNTDPADASAWTAAKANKYEFGLRADT